MALCNNGASTILEYYRSRESNKIKGRGLVLQVAVKPNRSCRFTWKENWIIVIMETVSSPGCSVEDQVMITVMMMIMCFCVCFGCWLLLSSGLNTKFTELFTDKFRVVTVCSSFHIYTIIYFFIYFFIYALLSLSIFLHCLFVCYLYVLLFFYFLISYSYIRVFAKK
jgi:hypothetical protein